MHDDFEISLYYPKLQKDPVHLMSTHIAEVQDEAISLVKAVPADGDLRCPDDTSTFHLQQTLNSNLIGDDVLEP